MIGEAKTGDEVIELCRSLKPDIVIMDIAMPEMDGIACTKILRSENPDVRILALTSYDDEEHLRDCILAGVSGYVLKRSLSDELKLALLAVHRGGLYIDAAVSQKLRDVVHSKKQKDIPLTDREIQVIALIAQGLSLKDISGQLKISVKTVETHKARSLEKLNLKSRADLVKYALQQGLFDLIP